MKYFILMADVIDSGTKEQKGLMDNFQELVKEINTIHLSEILSPLTITLGDEFQGVVKDLTAAVQIILNFEENIIHQNYDFKLRYILNQGEIETPINNRLAYGMLGHGLTDARFMLNDSKNKNNRFTFSIDNKMQNAILTDAFIIFENIIAKWDKKREFMIASKFIEFKDYKLVADNLHRNRSLMWKREKSLDFESYVSVKAIIQTISKQD